MVTTFRVIAMLEGISYLLLLGIAMPLKYLGGIHEAVTVAGWIHGGLFVLYLFALAAAWITQRWSIERVIIAGIASVVPFAPFFVDRKIKKEQQFNDNSAVN